MRGEFFKSAFLEVSSFVYWLEASINLGSRFATNRSRNRRRSSGLPLMIRKSSGKNATTLRSSKSEDVFLIPRPST